MLKCSVSFSSQKENKKWAPPMARFLGRGQEIPGNGIDQSSVFTWAHGQRDLIQNKRTVQFSVFSNYYGQDSGVPWELGRQRGRGQQGGGMQGRGQHSRESRKDETGARRRVQKRTGGRMTRTQKKRTVGRRKQYRYCIAQYQHYQYHG